MAFAVMDTIRETKEDSVASMGIGTDVLPAVFAFDRAGRVVSYAILVDVEDGGSVGTALLEGAAVMRRGWGCHAVALVQESYTGPHPEEGDDRTLAERFPTDRSVEECFTCLCVTVDGDAAYVVQPYRTSVPRRVEWLEAKVGVGRAADYERAELAHRIMTRMVVDIDPSAGAETLAELGFVSVLGD
jgi:hypothetical protein